MGIWQGSQLIAAKPAIASRAKTQSTHPHLLSPHPPILISLFFLVGVKHSAHMWHLLRLLLDRILSNGVNLLQTKSHPLKLTKYLFKIKEISPEHLEVEMILHNCCLRQTRLPCFEHPSYHFHIVILDLKYIILDSKYKILYLKFRHLKELSN